MANVLSDVRDSLHKLVMDKADAYFCVCQDREVEEEDQEYTEILGIFLQEAEAMDFLITRGWSRSELEPFLQGRGSVTRGDITVRMPRYSAYDLARYLEASLVSPYS